MNSYQIVFLIFILLPPIVSIVIDKLSYRDKEANWICWSDSIVSLYILETIIFVLVAIFVMLGDA